MTFLEYLDRVGERRAQRIQRPRDIRQLIGFAFLFGYYLMVYEFSQAALPAENLDLIRDAMLTLGPPIGIIIGAMFRSDAREEMATDNTARAFRAVEAVAKSGTTTPTDGASATDAAKETAAAAVDQAKEIKDRNE